MQTIVFTSVSAPEPVSYVTKILENWHAKVFWHGTTPVDLSQEAEKVVKSQLDAPLLCDVTNEKRDNEIIARQYCYRNELSLAFPLQENEKVSHYTFSILEEDYQEFQKGSVVCHRRSNFSDIYIFPDGWTIAGNSLEFDEPKSPDIARLGDLRGIETMVLDAQVNGLALKFAQSLAGSLGSALGSAIFGAIFPPGVPSYFTQVYKQIEKITHEQITQNTVDTLDGYINGLKLWVENTYTPKKQSGNYSKSDLTKDLEPKVSDLLIHVIGPLQQKNFASAGFAVFLIAANLHLALLQELALQDPKVSDPKKSANATSIKLYAATYSNYAKTTHAAINKARSGLVKVTDQSTQVCVLSRCTMKYAFNFVDSLNGYTSDTYYEWKDKKKNLHDGRGKAKAARGYYLNGFHLPPVNIEGILPKLASDLGSPELIMAQWKILESKPVG